MTKLMVLVPTRNRCSLAIRAVNSVLDSASADVIVMLSDNSTISAQVDELADFAAGRSDLRLLLRRPPEPMPMTAHWNWALSEATRDFSVTHVTVLTDRMMFKAGSVDALLALVQRFPHKVLSYDHDRVVDHRLPITVELNPWSDEVMMLRTERLLALSASCVFPSSLPRLLNCVVPRGILDTIHKMYGNVVGSECPDYNFCYRSLALLDDFAYWDRAPIFHYALGESNGESVSRGISTEANRDFFSTIQGSIFAAAPCPGIRSVGNAMVNEYCVIARTSRSTKFPSIEIGSYTQMLRKEINAMENRRVAMEMSQILEDWYKKVGASKESQQATIRRGGILRRMARRIRVGSSILRIRRLFSSPSFRTKKERIQPVFSSLENALDYAMSANGERLSAHRLTIYR